MWEFIAFVLFGIVMARVGATLGAQKAAERGMLHDGKHLYRVTRIEDKD